MSAYSNNVGVRKLFKSKVQQHRFNAPYQTGMNYRWPTRAYSTEHVVSHNDIVILGTDGLFDNLFEEDIIDIVRQHIDWDRKEEGGVTKEEQLTLRNPRLLSKQLSAMAEAKGYDPNYMSPFSVEA